MYMGSLSLSLCMSLYVAPRRKVCPDCLQTPRALEHMYIRTFRHIHRCIRTQHQTSDCFETATGFYDKSLRSFQVFGKANFQLQLFKRHSDKCVCLATLSEPYNTGHKLPHSKASPYADKAIPYRQTCVQSKTDICTNGDRNVYN